MTKVRRKGKRQHSVENGGKVALLRRGALFTLFAIFLASLGLVGWAHFHAKPAQSATHGVSAIAKQPPSVEELLAMPPAELEKCDIALMDLICARGLRGSEGLDINECLKRLDGWTEQVKWETQRQSYKYYEHPEQFRHSLGRYRMMMLGTVLAQDLGIHYNPDRIFELEQGKTPTPAWDANSQDIFINGLLDEKHAGTCASMPVLYVAIGRRLGYPVSLSSTKMHLYVWYAETNGEHFNVEATMTKGFLTPTDEDYKTGFFQCTPDEIKGYGWLRPLSNAEALGQFVLHRGICLALVKRYRDARKMYLAAARCWTDTPQERDATKEELHDLDIAPLGDKIEDLRNEIKSLSVPDGPRFAYLENRKGQLSYFLGDNTNWPSMEQAVNDLKYELAEYRKELATNSADARASTAENDPNALELASKYGKRLVLPAAGLPPPLNRGQCPPDYLQSMNLLDLQNEGLVWDALWAHFKTVNPDWMAQADKLPVRPLLTRDDASNFLR